MKRLFLFMTLGLFTVTLCSCVVYSSPSWLKTSTYVRYGTYSATLEWRCTDLNGKTAEMNVSFLRNDSQVLTATVNVDVESREVYLQNGTYIGKTILWLVANPTQDQVIEFDDGKSGKVDLGGWIRTIQGDQRIYLLRGTFGSVCYDLDTGILLDPWWGAADPALSKIGFPSVPGRISSTNIDLGPREWLPEIIMAMPYVLIAVAIVTVPAFVYWKRRQKRRQKAMLAERRQKKTKSNSKPA